MASRRTYTCFVCQKAGHEIQVFLDGKDEEGRTKYLNEDGTGHQHKQKQQQQPDTQSTNSRSNNNPIPLLRILEAKLERVISLLEKQAHVPG